jgi:hypothetical protein
VGKAFHYFLTAIFGWKKRESSLMCVTAGAMLSGLVTVTSYSKSRAISSKKSKDILAIYGRILPLTYSYRWRWPRCSTATKVYAVAISWIFVPFLAGDARCL